MVKSTVRLLWVLSSLALVYVLFSTYGELSPKWNLPGSSAFYTRDLYFYGMAGTFLLLNTLWYLLKNKVGQLDPKRSLLPNRDFWGQDKHHTRAFHGIMKAWMYAMGATTNYLQIVFMMVVFSVNSSQGLYQPVPNYHYYLALGVVVLAFAPFVRLGIKTRDLLDNRSE